MVYLGVFILAFNPQFGAQLPVNFLNINLLVFVTETLYVYCEIGNLFF